MNVEKNSKHEIALYARCLPVISDLMSSFVNLIDDSIIKVRCTSICKSRAGNSNKKNAQAQLSIFASQARR